LKSPAFLQQNCPIFCPLNQSKAGPDPNFDVIYSPVQSKFNKICYRPDPVQTKTSAHLFYTGKTDNQQNIPFSILEGKGLWKRDSSQGLGSIRVTIFVDSDSTRVTFSNELLDSSRNQMLETRVRVIFTKYLSLSWTNPVGLHTKKWVFFAL